ncbi:MAG: PilZ domain-containing protein [Bdellovibrionaceae bacterium]|nr:PilZ domain-containing protein [Pseudobdellovibrionaceae bacterium]
MSKILIHGLSIESTEKIRRKLEIQLSNSTIFTSTDLEKTKDIITEKSLKLLIYESEMYSNKELNLYKDFKVWGLSFSVLFICSNVIATDLDVMKRDSKPHFLNTKYEDKALIGIVKKLLRTHSIPQQMSARYHTNQMVKVEFIQQGDLLESSMYNLSKSGAYCEFDPMDNMNLTVGDLVRLSVPLSDISKSHALNAKVVWVTKKGRYSGRHGFGLKFVNNDEVYRSLLGKLS